MNVFNSLGSNYDFPFVLKSLFTKSVNADSRLKSYLEKKYTGKVILLYKGREAIELALTFLKLPKDSSVGINGFTCFAVYKSIINAGFKAEYIDLEDWKLNFSYNSLREKIETNPKIKVLIIQNTLGYPCEIEKISKVCKEKKIVLIEDLAHSIGTVYKNGKEAGTLGDFVVLSFSQDKVIDGISGGALIIRNKKYQDFSLKFEKVERNQQITDRLYPFFTYLIRSLYPVGIGKVLHSILKKGSLLSNPMGNEKIEKLHSLPNWLSNLSLIQFQDLRNNLIHRKQIASIYAKNTNSKILSKTVVQNISNSTNLRFPVFVKNRLDLIRYLKAQGIYISDIWYDAPIAPKKYVNLTDYKNQCPHAEKISSQILNLPTHRNVSEIKAREISERINAWLKSQ